jgi:tRNA A37 threonylcarbamoyladenosine dehydratase
VGGIGSVLSETLSKLGVGEILAIDFDKVEPPNLSRIPGATDWDAMTKLVTGKVGWIKRLGTRLRDTR